VHGFRLWAASVGKPLVELEIPNRLTFSKNYPDGRIAPFIRVVDRWVEGIDKGESTIPSLREGVYSQLLMDLSHESNEKGCWVDVPDLEAFLVGS